MPTNRTSLCLLIHSHQPVGNFDHVIEEAYQKSYAPFLTVLARHPAVRLSLHYSGILWQWIERHHPEFMRTVRELTDRGQVEHVGGGYYEPILASIPNEWKVKQVRRQSAFLQERFGASPRGAWVTERVWEQALIAPLAEAGIEYTVLDDTHFLAAGAEAEDLHEAYLTEESGAPLKLVPSLQQLRYTIPFREPQETFDILADSRHRGGMFAVGDDCEKFGVWPGTHEHCYTNRWLERFFEALEAAADWLEITTLSDYLSGHPPRRTIYLPTASYAEMMTWALPVKAAEEFEACIHAASRLSDGKRFQRFLRGGTWLNFLSKYPESNQTQKLMLHLARRWQEKRGSVAENTPEDDWLAEAETHLLAAQCNDSYWHGVFGGLYAPHLRSAVQKELIQAERLLDRLDSGRTAARIECKDFDCDGANELLASCPGAAAIVRPADGGTISSLRAVAAGVELINSITRRPEAYHRHIIEEDSARSPGEGAPASIHDKMPSKEANLGTHLRYDHYLRRAMRTYIFPHGKSWRDFESLCLGEVRGISQDPWTVESASGGSASIIVMRRAAELTGEWPSIALNATKSLTLSASVTHAGAWTLKCDLSLDSPAGAAFRGCAGVEIVLNMLAPASPDRYFSSPAGRHPLEFGGEIAGPDLGVVDEWQRLAISLNAPGARCWWTAPIETISQSEAGFERVYQGSSIMAVWDADLDPGSPRNFAVQMNVRIL